LLYKRATNFIENQSSYRKIEYDENSKRFGVPSSEVGTLYHKMIELFNKHLRDKELEGKFTGDDENSLKIWNDIKNTLSRRYLTYGSNKIYVSGFNKTVEEEMKNEDDEEVTKETNYYFQGYDGEDISKLDALYKLLDVENTDANKNTAILAMLLGIDEFKTRYDNLIENNDYIANFDKYINDLQEELAQAQEVGAKIDIEENIRVAQIFKLITSDKPISESAINNIFTLYAQYLSPVTVAVSIDDNEVYSYNTLARVNSVDIINAYDIGDNNELYNTLIEYIQSHDNLTYYDTKNFIVYLDTVLESFKTIYTILYEQYGKDCIIINEKTVGYNDNNGIRVVGTIDAAVVGKDKDDEDKVKIGILDFKTVGNHLFNSLTDDKTHSQKQLVEETIKKYGQKQYLYQELLAKLLDIDISEISNALLLEIQNIMRKVY
jgi:predicted XRE-type DNA-binding protein